MSFYNAMKIQRTERSELANSQRLESVSRDDLTDRFQAGTNHVGENRRVQDRDRTFRSVGIDPSVIDPDCPPMPDDIETFGPAPLLSGGVAAPRPPSQWPWPYRER